MTNNTTATASIWQVYILRCADGSLYTGITTNLVRRIQEHNSQKRSATRYTRSRQPVSLVYREDAISRSAAAKREYTIKQLDRAHKLALIKTYHGTV